MASKNAGVGFCLLRSDLFCLWYVYVRLKKVLFNHVYYDNDIFII